LKAAVLESLNSPLKITEIEQTDLSVGQVRVKIIVSGICGSQLHEIKGNKGNGKFLPHLLGHEGSGIVTEIGSGVTTVAVGDKVVMHWRTGSGIESGFPQYIWNGKTFSSGKVTTLSEYSIVSENRLTRVPADSPDDLCALLGCSLSTAFGVIDNELKLKFGESVAVVGCGGLGLSLIQAAKLKAAHPIYAIDLDSYKKQIAFEHGATSFHESVKSATRKFDVIIDTTGIPNVIDEAFGNLSGSGRLILVGQPEPGQDILLTNSLTFFDGKGKQIFATQGGSSDPERDIPKYLEMHKAQLFDVNKTITHRFNLNQVNEGFDMLRSGKAGRIMIDINREIGL
jgi:Zn-dependent alcohol dehydrogenase